MVGKGFSGILSTHTYNCYTRGGSECKKLVKDDVACISVSLYPSLSFLLASIYFEKKQFLLFNFLLLNHKKKT